MFIFSKQLALIILLFGLIDAGPLLKSEKNLLKGEVKCSKKCSDSKNFNYQIGRSYTYDFTTKNSIQKTNGNVLTEVEISGHARITVQSNCEHVLKLENVNIKGVDKDLKDKTVKELETNNLAYAFLDGEIENVCPLADEKDWTLNVKKAILSSLQFTPKESFSSVNNVKTQEKDVIGICETVYDLLSSDSNQYKFNKAKKMQSCSHKISVDSALLGSSPVIGDLAYSFFSMLVKNDHRCKLTIKKSGVVESVKCTEVSEGAKLYENDMLFLSEISLKLRNEDPVHYPQVTGEFYEDNLIAKKVDYFSEKPTVDLSKNLKSAVDGVCGSISNSTLSHGTAKEFRNLVHVIKHSNYESLKTQFNKLLVQRDQSMDAHHHNKLMSSELCCRQKLFKLYLDALISAKSDASLKLLVTDIVPNNFYLPEGSVRAELKLNSFYTSLAFLPNPTEETLRSVIPLLNLKGRHSRNALFGTTALAQNICKKKQKCEYPAIDEIANLISSKLPANCKSSSESQVVEKLKALENLPKLPEPVVKKLAQCLTSSDVSVNIKVNVLQNMAKQNCKAVKKISKDVLMNNSENDEVRIFAYKVFRNCIENSNDAKEIEKALLGNKGELASYIYDDVQQIREKQNIKCPKMLAIKQNLQSVNLKGIEIVGKSRKTTTYPLSLFFKSNLAIVNDVIYSKKSQKPISLHSEYKLKHHQIFKFGIRSETGSNILMNLANVETVVGSLTQLIKSFSSVKEDGKARLIDEWAAQVLPEIASALRDVDFFFQMNGKNLIYFGENDNNAVVADPIEKVKLGLVSMVAMNAESVYDMHFISGLSVFMSKERTFLTNLVLFDSEKVDKNKLTFEMTPNAVFSELNKINLPIGKNLNPYVLEKERLFTSNFGIKGTKTSSNNDVQIRFKFSQPKVDLISYQVFNKIYNGKDVKSVIPKEHNYDFCLDNILPIKKMFGFSLCAKCNEQIKGLILEKTEDSEVLVTFTTEKKNSLVTRKMVIEQEKSEHKRKLILTIANENKWPGSLNMFLEVVNPVGNGWTKLDVTENNLSLKTKINDQKVYSIEAERKVETKNKETTITAKINLILPGFNKPISGLYKAKVSKDKKQHYNGEFFINENTKLASLEYNLENNSQRVKRSTDLYLDFDYDLKVFSLSGDTLMHHKYDSNIKTTSATIKSLFEYYCRKTKKLENLVIDLNSNWSKDKIIKFSMLTDIKSSNHPQFNSKFDQKFAYKPSEHIENDIKIELDALGSGDERLIRLGSVYKLTKKNKKIDVDHLARIVINKFNYNREYNFIGSFDFSTKYGTFDTKLKIQDLSAANEVLSASALYKPVDVASNKYNLLIDYNCNKHGKFSWNEDISYDAKTSDVSTKIVLTVFKIDDQAPTVYTGEYNSSPKKNYFDFKLKKTNNDDVLIAKFDFTKPTEALIFYIEFEKERVIDFNGKLTDKNHLEAVNLKVKSLGELKLDNSKTADGRKTTFKLKTEHGYQQNVAIIFGNKIVSLEVNSSKNDKSIFQVELFVSNPSKTLKTYHDIQSGSISVKVPLFEVSFKQENLPSSKNLMFELKRLNLNRKLVVMAVKDNSKLALMTKLEKDGNSVYAFDSTFSLSTPSVINFKSENKVVNLNVNPFGFKEDEWKILSLDFALKNDKYKHNSIVMLKKEANNDRVLEIKSASKGQTSENKKFEHGLTVSVGNGLQNVKINLKAEKDGYGVDEINYLHDFNGKEKGSGFNLKHSLKLIIKDELVFSHDSKTKYDKIDYKLWDFSTMSEFKSSCKYLDGVKFDFKGNCNNEKTGKVEINIDYPYKNTTVFVSYMGKNTLNENFKRELKIDLSNSKLNYKDSYLAKLDIIYGLEFHLKYNKLANTGHKLENLELRLVAVPEEYSFLFIAPRGWNGHVKLAFAENITFSTNLVKRSRVLISVDSKINLKKENKFFAAVDAHTVFGFNGNSKFAEEKFQLSSNGLDYKFTSVLFNLDLNFKSSENKKKQNLSAKLCSAKKTDECALLDLNIVRKEKEANSQGTFKYGTGDEAINVNFDYSRQTLNNGDFKGKLIGDVNGKKLTGEINYIRKGESFAKFDLPSRVLYVKRVTLTNGFKYTFWPNYENEKTHEHSISYERRSAPDMIIKEFTVSHPAFKRELKSVIQIDKKNTMLISLDLNEDINKKLNFKFGSSKNQNTFKGSMHIYRNDKLIDFGCDQEYSLEKEKEFSSLDYLRMTHCFWVDKDNKKQIFNRELLSKVEFLENKKTKFSLYSKYLMEWPLINSLIEGKSIIDVEKLIATGSYLMTKKAEKRQLEYNYKEKCLNLDIYDLPKESYKNSYILNACTMNKVSDKSLFKIEYLMNRLDSKKKLNKDEKFLLKLNKVEDQQLLFVLHWDPEMIGEFIIDFGEMIEKDVEKKKIILDALSSEIEHKFGLLKTSLIDEFIIPIRKHRKDNLEKIIKEINPKLVPRFLNKREIKNSSLDVSYFGNIAKTLFNFKLLKSSLEDGQIEFLFTPHPTFQGTKHALKSTVQYLIKA